MKNIEVIEKIGVEPVSDVELAEVSRWLELRIS